MLQMHARKSFYLSIAWWFRASELEQPPKNLGVEPQILLLNRPALPRETTSHLGINEKPPFRIIFSVATTWV
jgi:hypothetical protein